MEVKHVSVEMLRSNGPSVLTLSVVKGDNVRAEINISIKMKLRVPLEDVKFK